ncbi:MAG TPA: hypothetical protein VN969_31580 [Streptosporangiaceae bacterium]|nr:hypothetical protein [Streptosporangiaceae bacterium]
MTIRADQGTLAFRVLCHFGGGIDASASLFEFIIDADHIDVLSRALAADPVGDSISGLPCRVGFSLGVANAAT